MRDELTLRDGPHRLRAHRVAAARRPCAAPTTTPRPSPPPAGRAIPGVEVRVVDDDGDELPRASRARSSSAGYNVMRGYFEDPAATADAIDADGWLHTGDIGVMDERGYLRITDRNKDMFIVGGFNAYPAEIEQVLARHDGVARGRGRRRARRAPGRGRPGLRRARAGADARADELIAYCQERHGQLQGAPLRGVRRRAAAQRQRQGAQDGPARRGMTPCATTRVIVTGGGQRDRRRDRRASPVVGRACGPVGRGI